MQKVTIKGTIVDKDPKSPFPARSNDGLYLLNNGDHVLRLIVDHMATQMDIEILHRRSRRVFDPYLNKNVTVEGYRGGSTLWSATIVDQEK